MCFGTYDQNMEIYNERHSYEVKRKYVHSFLEDSTIFFNFYEISNKKRMKLEKLIWLQLEHRQTE